MKSTEKSHGVSVEWGHLAHRRNTAYVELHMLSTCVVFKANLPDSYCCRALLVKESVK
jgi:hypothetical protein